MKWTKALASLVTIGICSGFFGSSYAEVGDLINAQGMESPIEFEFPEDLASNWARGDIYDARIYGLMNPRLGSQITTEISREEAAIVGLKLYERLVKGDLPEAIESLFQDTDSEEVRLANHLGIVNGVGNNLFNPNENVTRQDFAVIMKNVIEAVEVEFSGKQRLDQFSDNTEISPYAVDALDRLVSNDIINGRSQGMIYPLASITKEETLVMAKRIYERINDITGNSSKGLLYRVSNKENELYLLGSIHSAPSRAYPMSESIRRKINKSDILAVEADLENNMNEYFEFWHKYAFYEEGENLADSVSEETYNLLKEFFGEEMVFDDGTDINTLKPWALSGIILREELMYDSFELEEDSTQEDLIYRYTPGIDLFFIERYFTENKDIIELEGMEYQIKMQDRLSTELQDENLRNLLEGIKMDLDLEDEEEPLDFLFDMWKSGDKEGLTNFIAESKKVSSDEENHIKWYVRDKEMADKIEDYLSDLENRYLVVVGAGHLVTDDSIVDNLRNRGYTVERIEE